MVAVEKWVRPMESTKEEREREKEKQRTYVYTHTHRHTHACLYIHTEKGTSLISEFESLTQTLKVLNSSSLMKPIPFF